MELSIQKQGKSGFLMRLTGEQLEIIKEKLEVDRIWSFSKMSTFEQCTWSYKLKYIDKLRGKEDSCYTYWGTICHDIRQGFYDGDYKSNQEMLDKFEAEVIKYFGLLESKPFIKFPNETEHVKYFDNLRHYFANCKHVDSKVQNERVVIAVLTDKDNQKYAFQGYMDSFYEEDGKNYILDYKTSSMSGFTGDKLLDKSKQLMIYAYGLWKQQGIPIDSIMLRFDMMKYCNIKYTLKNGNEKVTRSERRHWVTTLVNAIRKDLEDVPKTIEALNKKADTLAKKRNAKCRTDEEISNLSIQINDIEEQVEALQNDIFDVFAINELVNQAIDDNNLDCMPQFIKDKYTVGDCYIDVALSEDIINAYVNGMTDALSSIVSAEEGEHTETFARSRIEDKESYFCNNLCDVRDSCKFYKEYREHNDMFLNKREQAVDDDEVILKMLGL